MYQSYIFNKLGILFKSEKGMVSETLPVRVLKPSSEKDADNLDKFPNLLGMDFLERGYKFYCDLGKGEISFEKEEQKER